MVRKHEAGKPHGQKPLALIHTIISSLKTEEQQCHIFW